MSNGKIKCFVCGSGMCCLDEVTGPEYISKTHVQYACCNPYCFQPEYTISRLDLGSWLTEN